MRKPKETKPEQLKTRAFKVIGKKTRGPYPAVKRTEEDEEERKKRKVPKSRKEIPLKEHSPQTKVMDQRSGDPQDHPVQFFTYQPTDKVGPKDAGENAMDLSGADSERGVVLLSGNWFCNYSTDNGNSFKTVDPTTVFPSWKDHKFCCDQVVIYVPSIDRFIWFMQHDADSKGVGAFRLAAGSTADIQKKFETAWTYWDFTSSTFGLTEGMDYPDLAFTNQFLYLSTDATTTDGRLVARFALSD